jgi:hypothetical protein
MDAVASASLDEASLSGRFPRRVAAGVVDDADDKERRLDLGMDRAYGMFG